MEDPFKGLNDAVASLREYVDKHKPGHLVVVVFDYVNHKEIVFGPFTQVDIMSSTIWGHRSGHKFELGIKAGEWWELQDPEIRAPDKPNPLTRGKEVWVRAA
ncbi:hypothetical protein LCGC14_2244510 [marine sediment metagenome]|uniref:Uncharacterized protein n=1 Tax=marine sediment metagenome TaxID=412755 RepID=A0A0F9DS15_9ZZZZ